MSDIKLQLPKKPRQYWDINKDGQRLGMCINNAVKIVTVTQENIELKDIKNWTRTLWTMSKELEGELIEK